MVQRLIHQDREVGCWDVSPGRLTKADVAAVRTLLAEFKDDKAAPVVHVDYRRTD
jgi:hypothetical protein